MKKALTTTAAALLALSAHAQSATSPAATGSGSASSGIATSPNAATPSASTRPIVDPDGPIGAFWSQDSFRNAAPAPSGTIGVNERPSVRPLPGTTSIDTRPGLAGPTTGVASPTAGLPPRGDVNLATPGGSINDSSRWELELPESAVGAPGTGALQTGSARSIPSTGGVPRVPTGSLPPAVTDDTLRPQSGAGAQSGVLNQAGGATTTDSTTVIEGSKRADPKTSAASAASLNTTGIETPAAIKEAPLDRALSAKIRSKLSETGPRDQMIPPTVARNVRITSQNGRVTLEGDVSSEAERKIIEMRARQVHGIAQLDNRLTVRGQGSGPAGLEGSGSELQPPRVRPGGAPATGERGEGTSLDPDDDLDLDDRHLEILPPP